MHAVYMCIFKFGFVNVHVAHGLAFQYMTSHSVPDLRPQSHILVYKPTYARINHCQLHIQYFKRLFTASISPADANTFAKLPTLVASSLHCIHLYSA